MAIPLIVPLAAGAAALYFMFRKPSSITSNADGTVTTTVPTVDGKGYKLTTTPELLSAIMAMSQTNDAGKMTSMAAQFMAEGRVNEAIACQHLAAVIATNQATGGASVSPKAANASTAAASVPSANVAATPSKALLDALKTAKDSGSPAKLRKVADQFEKAGFPAQAASIRAAADELEKSLKEATKVTSPGLPQPATTTPTVSMPTLPGLPSIPIPTAAPTPTVSIPVPAATPTPAPALPTPVAQPKPTARRATADAVVQELGVRRPAYGKENTAIVRAYESALGLTPSGKYGIGLAKSLAEPESGSHVPPPVRYWPASAKSVAKYGNYIKAAAAYDDWLMMQKATNPARASEWQDAYQHARDFWPSGSKPQPRK